MVANKRPAINLSPNPLDCEYRQKKQKLSLKMSCIVRKEVSASTALFSF